MPTATAPAAPVAALPALPPGDCLLTVAGVCQYLSCSRWTLYRRLAEGLVPRPVRLKSRPYWRLSELQAFIAGLRPTQPAA